MKEDWITHHQTCKRSLLLHSPPLIQGKVSVLGTAYHPEQDYHHYGESLTKSSMSASRCANPTRKPENWDLPSTSTPLHDVADNDSAREFLGDDKLRELALALTDKVLQRFPDWTTKEDV